MNRLLIIIALSAPRHWRLIFRNPEGKAAAIFIMAQNAVARDKLDGLLMGAIPTQQPADFRARVSHVGVYDSLHELPLNHREAKYIPSG